MRRKLARCLGKPDSVVSAMVKPFQVPGNLFDSLARLLKQRIGVHRGQTHHPDIIITYTPGGAQCRSRWYTRTSSSWPYFLPECNCNPQGAQGQLFDPASVPPPNKFFCFPHITKASSNHVRSGPSLAMPRSKHSAGREDHEKLQRHKLWWLHLISREILSWTPGSIPNDGILEEMQKSNIMTGRTGYTWVTINSHIMLLIKHSAARRPPPHPEAMRPRSRKAVNIAWTLHSAGPVHGGCPWIFGVSERENLAIGGPPQMTIPPFAQVSGFDN